MEPHDLSPRLEFVDIKEFEECEIFVKVELEDGKK